MHEMVGSAALFALTAFAPADKAALKRALVQCLGQTDSQNLEFPPDGGTDVNCRRPRSPPQALALPCTAVRGLVCAAARTYCPSPFLQHCVA